MKTFIFSPHPSIQQNGGTTKWQKNPMVEHYFLPLPPTRFPICFHPRFRVPRHFPRFRQLAQPGRGLPPPSFQGPTGAVASCCDKKKEKIILMIGRKMLQLTVRARKVKKTRKAPFAKRDFQFFLDKKSIDCFWILELTSNFFMPIRSSRKSMTMTPMCFIYSAIRNNKIFLGQPIGTGREGERGKTISAL